MYDVRNLATPKKTYSSTISPNGGTYDNYVVRLIDDIPLGDYRVIATVTDDFGESATITKDFTAHDLWIKGNVTHTTKWENNRQTYNTKYPGKVRDINTYWSGEAFETSANTTVINEQSNVVCTKVSVQVINPNNTNDLKYLDWLNNSNVSNDKWKLYYARPEWDNKWGNITPQQLKLRFTSYFNNDWVEIDDVIITIDNLDPFWQLHREW